MRHPVHIYIRSMFDIECRQRGQHQVRFASIATIIEPSGSFPTGRHPRVAPTRTVQLAPGIVFSVPPPRANLVMRDNIVSINKASELLERDRRTIRRAVLSLSPDAFDPRGQPRWKLARVVSALGALDGLRPDVNHRRRMNAADEIELIGRRLSEGIESLRAASELGERRKLVVQIGPLVGALNSAMEQANVTLSENERELLSHFRVQVIGQVVSEIMDLCAFQLARENSKESNDGVVQEGRRSDRCSAG